jgi:transmembrane sensor
MNDGDDCRREAADWMILLQEQPDDDAVRAEFQRWRREPACDAAWQELDHVGNLIRQTGALASARPIRFARHRTAILPAAMAACFVGLFAGWALLPLAFADVTTGTGQMQVLRLADGSRVTLAPRSAITLDGPSRQVRLLSGAAFLQVRHDAAHPFRVLAGEAEATDLGTAFEVRRDDDGIHIAVREGRVRAACRDGAIAPIDLRPSDMAAIDCAAGRSRASTLAPAAMASWTQGQLVVTDRPLRDVVAALRPWHHGLLLARGAGMARHVTGVYDLRHTDQALTAMRRAHGVTVRQITPWVSVVTAD